MSREKFLKAYAGLPFNLRDEIVAMVDDEPITWKAAYREVSGNTALGKTILKKLEALGLLG